MGVFPRRGEEMNEISWSKVLSHYNEGSTQAEIAKKYKIPQSSVSNILWGGRYPQLPVQIKIAAVECLRVSDIIRDLEDGRYG
jgi:DNA-binding transcriptional regulator LsrR (DeoR family)